MIPPPKLWWHWRSLCPWSHAVAYILCCGMLLLLLGLVVQPPSSPNLSSGAAAFFDIEEEEEEEEEEEALLGEKKRAGSPDLSVGAQKFAKTSSHTSTKTAVFLEVWNALSLKVSKFRVRVWHSCNLLVFRNERSIFHTYLRLPSALSPTDTIANAVVFATRTSHSYSQPKHNHNQPAADDRLASCFLPAAGPRVTLVRLLSDGSWQPWGFSGQLDRNSAVQQSPAMVLQVLLMM